MQLLTRQSLAKRWGVSVKTVDRLRKQGLPWFALNSAEGQFRHIVRFKLADIEAFETRRTRTITSQPE